MNQNAQRWVYVCLCVCVLVKGMLCMLRFWICNNILKATICYGWKCNAYFCIYIILHLWISKTVRLVCNLHLDFLVSETSCRYKVEKKKTNYNIKFWLTLRGIELIVKVQVCFQSYGFLHYSELFIILKIQWKLCVSLVYIFVPKLF